MNTIGQLFRLTSFGESHGEAIGGIVDGCPAGILLDLESVQKELDRRRPGQSHLTTGRNEADRVEFLSGLFEGKTTGTPIGFMIRNSNQHTSDYDDLRTVFRPSHADFTYHIKYGIRDHRGGGRSSARETAARVVAGAIAKQILQIQGVSVVAYTSQVGPISTAFISDPDPLLIESNPVRCADRERAEEMALLIKSVKAEGDTIGGVITCVCKGVPAGLGEPVFGKLHASLGAAMLSINAAKGFEYGMGFDGAGCRGSRMNDPFTVRSQGRVETRTNHSGGIQGGISNGEDIFFRVAFKPVPTLLQPQKTIDATGREVIIHPHGRHDPCVLPRAVPVVEAMAAITLLDHFLLQKTRK